ncbi:DUF29 domain-containing protein [Geminocystis sp. GBBB08]|uniref:DUF29 domain-containing protein n=1 Tax=Geminocystis sp. GBBB08 TaxID=2604140 RepID=UPI0027E2897C|nr:DUF29 domain-containing protein [Geminocystis sp. GBBB08]MBL1208679.1 DUF29 domain-containing protein [Geminocystis sp. GBBB08]
MLTTNDLKQLYEIDETLWLEKTIELLKNKQYESLDLENLIEELEFLGKREKVTVESLLEQVIRHLLLCDYWTQEELSRNHWEVEIKSFRKQINKILTTNLRNHLEQNLSSIYEDALEYVQGKTRYKVEFPTGCPYTLNYLLMGK